MFKETSEGQTHSYNDGCGESAHNITHSDCCNSEVNEFHDPQNILHIFYDCTKCKRACTVHNVPATL